MPDIAVLPNRIQILKTLPLTHIFPALSRVVGFSCLGKDLVCFGQMGNSKKSRWLAFPQGPVCSSYGCLALFQRLFTFSPQGMQGGVL